MSRTRLLGAATIAYAVAAYATFLAATAWGVTFLADLELPRGIDHGPRHAAAVAVAIDLALLGLFAVQHTVMARAGFKRRLGRWASAPVERSTYVLATSVVLLLLFWQWQPPGGRVWDLHGLAAAALWAVFALGWLVAVSSTYMVDHWDFLGLRKAYRYARGRPAADVAFREQWFYRWVRHPMMLGLVLAFWATPRMTGGHLLFAALTTAYIAVGVQFEERDLKRELGDVYRDYAERVPAIVPFRSPRGSSDRPSPTGG